MGRKENKTEIDTSNLLKLPNGVDLNANIDNVNRLMVEALMGKQKFKRVSHSINESHFSYLSPAFQPDSPTQTQTNIEMSVFDTHHETSNNQTTCNNFYFIF